MHGTFGAKIEIQWSRERRATIKGKIELMKHFIFQKIPAFAVPLAVMLAVTATCCSVARADQFGDPNHTFAIEFVTIGDAGNAADTTGDPNPAGAVPYTYRIGKYEISEQMINKANAQSALDGDPLGITIDARGPDKPATRASWFEAARFVNWLNTSTGNLPAYNFDPNDTFQLWEAGDAGYNPNNKFRNTLARYFLPSADEWYKAAFFDPVSDTWFDFPNGKNTAPAPVASGTDPNTAVYDQAGPADIMLAGGESPFGTVAQAGNVWEWEETEGDLVNDDPQAPHGIRGNNWSSISGDPTGLSSSFRSFILSPNSSNAAVGFRVASIVPEPTTFYLAILAGSAFLTRRRWAAGF